MSFYLLPPKTPWLPWVVEPPPNERVGAFPPPKDGLGALPPNERVGALSLNERLGALPPKVCPVLGRSKTWVGSWIELPRSAPNGRVGIAGTVDRVLLCRLLKAPLPRLSDAALPPNIRVCVLLSNERLLRES